MDTAALKGMVSEMLTGKPNNAKFFVQPATTNKRGELYELRAELNGDTKAIRKDAVKRVIASMTLGKDVSSLFADVVKNMQTEDLELKKLVYLYLTNYAKSQPELVILAINTFVKDCDDINPLIRAMAIRTMGCLRVQKMTDYLCEPLKKALKDDHPYVRKTAAICVTKLHDLDRELTQENGFVQMLHELLSDANPMVVANAVASLAEISMSSQESVMQINVQLLNKLLTALNECTEWGQIYILEALAAYQPTSAQEAEGVVDRVLPRLQHVNSSVVMAAVKVLVVYMEHVTNEETLATYTRKLSPPLVTLLSSPPEVQYVALRNIDLILQRRPGVLSNEIRVFFCKYNDTPYVKLAKLEILIKLVSLQNMDLVVGELKEYAQEVDVDFVRMSIQCIGRCAVKLEQSAEKCVAALVELIKNRVNYVVQECIVVIKDIFRRYPNRYESVIPVLCEALESLDEPEAKSSMIWIVGEYAHKIENAAELLQHFMETFKLEVTQVQMQLLTACVKLFLKRPQNNQELVQKVLQTATTTGESADLRDKAYMYWRLLSADPRLTKQIVMAERPTIVSDTQQLPPALLAELIRLLGTVASIYAKSPSTFLSGSAAVKAGVAAQQAAGGDEGDGAAGGDEEMVQAGGDLLDLDFGTEAVVAPSSATPQQATAPQGYSGNKDLLDLLG